MTARPVTGATPIRRASEPDTPARIAVTGYAHEVNGLAEPITLGHGIDAAQTPGGLAATWDAGALLRRLHELGPVEIVELPVWEFGASGPLVGDDFRTVLAGVDRAFAAAGPVDAVVVLGHGAGRTTDDLDPDATFLRLVRGHAGDAPVVVVLDFHANSSTAMCDLADVLVGYRTNPHVDIEDRLVEAAEHTHRLLDGRPTVVARCGTPLLLPQIAQLTTPGEPLGRVVDRGQALLGDGVLNVSLLGGFSLSDVPDGGTSICVSADAAAAPRAAAVARELAELAWALRHEYRISAVPLAESVARARRAARGDEAPVLLADVADNPGGGAPGNSTFVVGALLDAGVGEVVAGLHHDPAAVEVAWGAGVGGRCRIVLNEGSTNDLARPLALDATVLTLVDGPVVPTKGVYAGATRHLGRSCAVQVGGVALAITSHRVQCAEDDTLCHVGLDPARARVVVVKSRGHFRAGFAHLFTPDQIVEVGAPGVATPDLASVRWRHQRRPVFPLDRIDGWEPVVTLHRARGGS